MNEKVGFTKLVHQHQPYRALQDHESVLSTLSDQKAVVGGEGFNSSDIWLLVPNSTPHVFRHILLLASEVAIMKSLDVPKIPAGILSTDETNR